MKRVRTLCFFTTSLILVSPAGQAADFAHCPIVRSAEPLVSLEALFDDMAAMSIGSPNDNPDVNNEAMDEEGPSGQTLSEIWEYEYLTGPVPAVRFEGGAATPRVELPEPELVLPNSDWPCLLAPGDQVFVADNFTDHSTMIYRIEPGPDIVTFIDPRADENFLLSENSVLEDFGGRWFMEGDRKLFSVPFKTMDLVLKGAVLAPSMDPDLLSGIVQKLAPAVPIQHIQYWRDADYLAAFDPRAPQGTNLDHLLKNVDDVLLGNEKNYFIVLAAITDVIDGISDGLGDDYDGAFPGFATHLSRNMNFRILHDLMIAGDSAHAADFAVNYFNVRGFDLDMAVVGAAMCHATGDEECADHLRAMAYDDLSPRLDRMFRGGTPAEDRAMLDRFGYEVASVFLMRRRLAVLESW